MSTSLVELKQRTTELVKRAKDEKLAPAKRATAFVELVDVMKSQYLGAFPPCDRDLFVGGLQAVLDGKNGHDLIKSSFNSLTRFVKECNAQRLQIGGSYPDAYPVSYGGDVTTVVSWRGLVKMAGRSGELSKPPTVQVVYEGEKCELSYRDGDFEISHTLDFKNKHRNANRDSAVTNVYMVAEFRTGAKTRLVMTREQIDAHKERYAKGWRSGGSAWNTNWEAMARKTVLRVACNRGLLPLSASDRALAMRDDDTGDVVDASWEVIEDDTPKLPQTEDPNEGGLDIYAESKAVYLRHLDDADDAQSVQSATKACVDFLAEVGELDGSSVGQWAAAEREATIKKINERRRAQ